MSFSGNQDNPHCFFYCYVQTSDSIQHKKNLFFLQLWMLYLLPFLYFLPRKWYEGYFKHAEIKTWVSDNCGKNPQQLINIAKVFFPKTIYINTEIVRILLAFPFVRCSASTYPFSRSWSHMLRWQIKSFRVSDLLQAVTPVCLTSSDPLQK